MKNIAFILFIILMQNNSFGQVNLVPNPSFETHTSCPTNLGQLYKASPWYTPTQGTTDYFNVCAIDSTGVAYTGIPNNFWGYQPAKTGNAYAGIGTDGYIDEYLGVKLDSSLRANVRYCVEFYVSLDNYAKYSTSSIGAYFSTTMLTDYSIATNLPVTPQVENPPGRLLSDTANWMLVSGSFIANGGERYLTIGNFLSMSSSVRDTTYPTNTDNIMYYYIDDISVKACPDSTSGIDVIQTPELGIPTQLSGDQYFEIKNLPRKTALTLYSSFGQMVYSNTNYSNDLSVAEFRTGIYYYYLKLNNGVIRRGKLFVLH